MYVYDLQSYKAQSIPQKVLFYIKEKADPDWLKRFIQTRPHMSMSRCGNICIMPPKCSRKERRQGFSNQSSVDAAMSGRHCVHLIFLITLFGLLKVDAIRNHWLRVVYNRTAQPKCSNLCIAFYGRQFREPSRVQGWLCTKDISKKEKLCYDNLPLLN